MREGKKDRMEKRKKTEKKRKRRERGEETKYRVKRRIEATEKC